MVSRAGASRRGKAAQSRAKRGIFDLFGQKPETSYARTVGLTFSKVFGISGSVRDSVPRSDISGIGLIGVHRIFVENLMKNPVDLRDFLVFEFSKIFRRDNGSFFG